MIDFGFWIADFGLKTAGAIQNPQSEWLHAVGMSGQVGGFLAKNGRFSK
jgi:hypothetical protein